jgi:hypothetical protein
LAARCIGARGSATRVSRESVVPQTGESARFRSELCGSGSDCCGAVAEEGEQVAEAGELALGRGESSAKPGEFVRPRGLAVALAYLAVLAVFAAIGYLFIPTLVHQVNEFVRAVPGYIDDLTAGRGCAASIDCSGSGAARLFALTHTRTWGRCAFVGEGGQITFPVSELLIHKQITLHGSWVTSLRHMEDLLEHLVRWNLHPERIVTHRYPLRQADEAYRVADRGAAGKVCIVFE